MHRRSPTQLPSEEDGTSPWRDQKQVAICSNVQREKRPEDQEETPMLDRGLPCVDGDMLST